MKENNENNEVVNEEEEEEEVALSNRDLLTVRNAGKQQVDDGNVNESQINVNANNESQINVNVNNNSINADIKSNNSIAISNINNPLTSRSKETPLTQQQIQQQQQQPSSNSIDIHSNHSTSLSSSQLIINPTYPYTYWKNQLAERISDSFIDQLFPPITESLLDKKIKTSHVEKINIHEVNWKKLTDIYPNTPLTIFPSNDHSSLTINYLENKGYLFEQYTPFYHAVSLLISRFPKIIPQLFKTKNFNIEGYYELYMYTNGEFKVVIIDDYFPIVKGTNSLRFAKPNDNEIWLLLLEKAFAKVNGGYAALLSTNMSLVLQTFTGFPIERINIFDMDIEDTENVIRMNKNDNIVSCSANDKGVNFGLVRANTYEIVELFDIRSKDNNGNEIDIKLVKLRNMTNANKYKGEWHNNSEMFSEDVKVVINYKPDEQQHTLFMPIENFYEYFNVMYILTPMFNVHTKWIHITNAVNDEDKVTRPQCFNMYLPQNTKVSFTAVVVNNELSLETTTYAVDLANYYKINPFTICISKYDPERRSFANFEGCFRSEASCEMARSLSEGYYIIWTYLNMNQCSSPLPSSYHIKVSADADMKFNLRLQTADYKFNLIKEMIYSGVLQYQSAHMKDNEIYTMNDSFYNFSGLGLKVIVNPFKDCYQRWMFKPMMDNMVLLFPYENTKQLEIEVKPQNHWVVVAMRVDGGKPCVFGMKSLFKTFKVNEDNKNLLHNLYTEDNAFNYVEFCSSDIKNTNMG